MPLAQGPRIVPIPEHYNDKIVEINTIERNAHDLVSALKIKHANLLFEVEKEFNARGDRIVIDKINNNFLIFPAGQAQNSRINQTPISSPAPSQFPTQKTYDPSLFSKFKKAWLNKK